MSTDAHSKKSKLNADQPDETRQLILQTAQRLFFEYGYRAVTTRQIALACELTQPALYHHFTDKQDLYVAVLIQELNRIKTALVGASEHSVQLDERLQGVATYLLTYSKQDMALMFHDIAHELSVEAQAVVGQAFYECELKPIITIFKDGQDQGRLRGPDEGGVAPEMAAHLFLSLIANFLGENREDFFRFVGHNPTEIARLLVQLQLQGVGKPLY